MGRRMAVCVLAVLLWGLPAVAFADPVVISFTRVVQASARAAYPTTVTADHKSDTDWLAAHAAAHRQGSTATAAAELASGLAPDFRHLFASSSTGVTATTSGALGEDGPVASGSGITDLFLRFTIAEPYRYAFAGTFISSGPPQDPLRSAHGEWQAYLRSATDPSASLFYFFSRESGSPIESGLLSPGMYDFFVRGAAGAFADGTVSRSAFTRHEFTFDLRPAEDVPVVPEPATLLLIGTGLAGTILRRRVHAPRSK